MSWHSYPARLFKVLDGERLQVEILFPPFPLVYRPILRLADYAAPEQAGPLLALGRQAAQALATALQGEELQVFAHEDEGRAGVFWASVTVCPPSGAPYDLGEALIARGFGKAWMSGLLRPTFDPAAPYPLVPVPTTTP